MGHRWIGLAIILAMVGGCSGDDTEDPECGNGVLEVGEQCDGEPLQGLSCADVGLGQGEVSCTDDCHLDLSGCSTPPSCGNGVRDAGEACDGTDVGGVTCVDLGFAAGALHCLPACVLDLTDCGSGCQDGCTVEGATQCDASTIQTCALGAEGCLGWQDTFDCGLALPPQACDDSGAAAVCAVVCTDECAAPGEGQCIFDDAILQTCALQPSGCFGWENAEDCTLLSSSGFCDAAAAPPACKACHEDCTVVGAIECSGTELQTCVEVVPGCLEWQTLEDCADQGRWCGTCGPGDIPSCLLGC